jgi:hypothetical protein
MANILKTSVAQHGLTAMLQRLGGDCVPTQFVREFTMNSIEAIQRTKKPGKIFVDVNWDLFEKHPVHKICFTDTGDGMTADEMLAHLNNLSSSGPTRGRFENYGMGAKIAALTRNHAGVVYDSWKDGKGSRIVIAYDEQERAYGVRPVEMDGRASWSIALGDDEKPAGIGSHGTRVTLLGMSDGDDTMQPPSDAKGGRENWLHQYLNTRFFEMPDGVEIFVRVGYYRDPENKKHNYLRNIRGQKATLDEYALSRGSVELSDAAVHWWILRGERSGHGREYVIGHTGCVHQNELFDLADGRSSRAHGFGIILGREDVVLYVEPGAGYTQDTTRTRLRQSDGAELPWSRWYDEFRVKMPAEVSEFIRAKLNAAENKSHSDSIRERLKGIREFFRLSRYRATVRGEISADPDSETKAGTGDHRSRTDASGGGRSVGDGKGPGMLQQILLSARKDGGVAAGEVSPDHFPKFQWISVSDGTRAPDELDDRAAEYLERDNLIRANADFQGFTDVTKYFASLYDGAEGAEHVIKEEVQEAFEQQLIEVVTGALALKNRPKWNPDQFTACVSQEALTAAVMTRYHLVNQIKRSVGNKLGKIQKSAEEAA